MGIGNRVIKLLSSSAVLFATGSYVAAYILLQYSGLFSTPPDNIIRVLHQWPALAGAGVLVLSGATGLMFMRHSAGTVGRYRGMSSSLIGYSGLLLMGLGVLISSLTRFEGSITLHEDQELTLTDTVYDAGTVYRRMFSAAPEGIIIPRKITLLPMLGRSTSSRSSTDAIYRKDQSSAPRELHIGSMVPSLAGGSLYRVKDAGYSPHVFLFDLSGNTILDVYVDMRLFPAGVEDSFRFDKVIPHTFYLRYYPDVSLVPGNKTDFDIKSGPAFKVRIARNLDLIVDKYAAPGEMIPVDALLLSVNDVKKWTEIQIVNDHGVYILLLGIVLIIMWAVSGLLKRFGIIA